MEIETKADENLQSRDYGAAGHNAIMHLPVRSAARDAELITCDAIAEVAHLLVQEAIELREAASAGRIKPAEGRLLRCKLLLKYGCVTWRETFPANGRLPR
jgi:hypothetical protein